MANKEHLDILKQGVETWNQWRREHSVITPDFSEADLSGANLNKANFLGAFLYRTNLSGANLYRADLSGANIYRADLSGANLVGADLSHATFFSVNLHHSNLTFANLTFATLNEVDLGRANLIEAKLDGAILTKCFVYGVSAWDITLENTIQTDLIITRPWQSAITVDNLEVAQFIYLLLNNPRIRDVIDTITSKVVLILGRFTPERKAILDVLRDELRKRNYSPILFDFEKPASRDITETVSTLAHMARFVIADITDAKSIPQELMAIVPNLPSVALQPLILDSQHEYGMFEYFTRYPWVLPIYRYTDEAGLLQALEEKIIDPAEQKAKELAKRLERP
jgi:hypothetical protein